MKIKESNKHGPVIRKLKSLKRYKVLVGLFILCFYSAVLILLGGNLHKEGFFGEVLKPLFQENIRIPVNYVKGILSNPEHIEIDIKHKDYQKLAYKRKIAVEEGVLHPFKDDFVPAKVRWNGKTIKVKMRLKGDLADHWSRDHKWSYRIKTKGDNSIMGMANFSIQHPTTRGYLNDWYLHKILDHFGFITLRFDFIDVTVNGKHLGIYAIEEHFERRLVENNKHINAPIIRIKDHLLWYLVDTKTGFDRKHIDELYSSSPIDAFNTGTVKQDPVLLENFNKAKNLLEAFRRGKLLTHQVFDIDKISKIFAVIDLFGYRHSTAYSNIRFYYNPITSLLVPIGYDNTFIMEADSIEGQGKRIKVDVSENPQRLDWRKTFFEDKVFFRKYIEALKKVSEKEFLDTIFQNTEEEYEEKLNIIYSNFPGYNFSKQKDKLYRNQKYIQKTLNPLEGIQAYYKSVDENKGILTLQLGNIRLLPIEILSVSYGGHILPVLQNQVLLQTKTAFRPIEFKQVQFKLPKGIFLPPDFSDYIKVNYKIFGTNNKKEIPVFKWTYLDNDFLATDFIRQKPNYESFDLLDVDNERKRIFIKPGVWNIDKNLIIPEGFIVICRNGTQLNLSNSAKILSYSPLDFVGSDESRIVIKSNDNTGQGIVVIKANKKSILNNVIFKNLSSPAQGGWQVPGVVTFYESEVDIRNTRFIGNKSGAALSIIRSDFNISNSVFMKTFSDALSVTFGKGRITKTTFNDSKRDGMRFIGSVINVEDVYVNKVLNAGVSADANSEVNIKNIDIDNAQIAVESKNLSSVVIQNAEISNSSIAFFVTQDKSEFGSAVILANDLKVNNIEKANRVKGKSLLKINGKILK